jgi:RNA polymerase sigma-70 factor (ECF subfamily)
MSVGDAEAVSRCLAGDTAAFEGLVRKYQPAVYATAYYYVGRYNAAEDVAQEAFWAAYRSLPRLEEPAAFAGWLREITCRSAANWLRRHAKRLDNETPLPQRRTVNIEDVRQSPAGRLEEGERLERVRKAIDALPQRYRLPVVLRYVQELSYDEIAAFTGESREEIRGVLQRAGRQLRIMLSDEDEAAGGDQDWPRART